MTCEECLLALEDLVGGELAEPMAARAALHLGACASCARELELLEREERVLGEYLRAAEPPARLGAAFREALAREPRPAGRTPGVRLRRLLAGLDPVRPRLAVALGAVAVLLVGGAVTVVRRLPMVGPHPHGAEVAAESPADREVVPHRPEGRAPEPPPLADRAQRAGGREHAKGAGAAAGARRRTRAAAPANTGVAAAVEKAERRYEEATAELSREMEARFARLDPAEAVRLRADLGELDRVIASSKLAVRMDPADAEAVRYLTAAYLAKLDLLRRSAADE